uniref:hypothetical protein n=1 Tax=Meridianimarinicoccus zhengii TaxID=2056810 RepID=UPI0013A6A41B
KWRGGQWLPINWKPGFLIRQDGASCLDVALDRLGAWFDAEIGDLEDLLDMTGHEGAIGDIEALYRLHLDADAAPGDVESLLKGVRPTLRRLLKRVRSIPLDGPAGKPIPSSFNMWVCWSGARLEDILATLDRAMAA